MVSDRKTGGSAGRILRRFAATNFLIFLLPTAFALVYYQVSAAAIMRSTDDLALSQLDAGLATLDKAFAELRRSAVRFSTDYEINLYLNKAGPLSGIETYNLKRIADKVAPLVHGSDLVSDCFIFFARSGMVVYESGFSAYSDFYGPLLSVDGYGPAEWRELILSSAEGESLLPGLRLTFGGRTFAATAALWPLGYGDYIRGAVVGIMDERNLTKPLERLASEYKGWVAVLDGGGEVISIAGSGKAPRGLIGTVGEVGRAARTLRIGKVSYRLYRSASSTSGWSYMAALDEGSVLAGARRVRDSALVLLVLALAAGSLASLRLASSQARPLGRLLSLLLGAEDRAEDQTGSVYQRAEEAIIALSDSRDRLRAEAIEAEETARAYFLRRLLEGAYRERSLFEAEAARFGIDLSGPARYVLICGMTAPEDAGDPAGPRSADLRGIPPGERGLEAGEYGARVSLGETAYILKAAADRRAVVARMAESIRATAPSEVRSGLSFACGRPVDDPFLLQASYLQAKAALARRASGAVEAVFYEDLPESPGGLRFAIDVEESIMKAVRSANGLLLSSLVDSVLRSNFGERTLAPAEERDLATGLRIAALRLLPEFPSDASALRERLYARPEPSDARASIEDCAAVLAEMAELAGKRKRSHNRQLADQVRRFIERNYASRDLGLTMVAEAHRLSENYLSNLYKEQEGECVSETIERVRIDAARGLLSETAGSVDAIAAACGYANGVSFRRAFKRSVGVSPSDFRASAGAGGGGRG